MCNIELQYVLLHWLQQEIRNPYSRFLQWTIASTFEANNDRKIILGIDYRTDDKIATEYLFF